MERKESWEFYRYVHQAQQASNSNFSTIILVAAELWP